MSRRVPPATRIPLPVLSAPEAGHLSPHREKYELCAYCPKMCRFSCPVSEADARESLTPWAKMSAPFLAMSPAPEVSLEAAFETAWACTGCGHCREYCLHGNDVPTALAATRAAGVAAGLASPVTERVRAAFQPERRARPPAWRERVPADLRDSVHAPAANAAPVLFLPGCGDTRGAETVKSAVSLMERLGGRGVAIACDGACCGAALWWAGLPELFDEHAARFAESVAKRRTLVLADAGCAWTLQVLYARRGHRIAPEVLHVSEWVAAFFRERVLKARTRVPGAFLYHDPCMLARDLDVVDEPRAVLAATLERPAGEFAWNRRDTVCCGGGGLLPETMPDTAGRMAGRRADEARAAGSAVVTSCPTCLQQFRGAGVEAHDLLTLIARAL